MEAEHRQKPNWDTLYQIAELQGGYFTSEQAHSAGYSPQLLKYNLGKRIERIRRGIYRLIHFPLQENSDYIVDWLWSERTGVFAFDTALFLHNLSDALPSKRTMLVPSSWRKRRLQPPEGLVLRFGEVEQPSWLDAIPVTNVFKTLQMCSTKPQFWDLFQQGMEEAFERGALLDEQYQALKLIESPYE